MSNEMHELHVDRMLKLLDESGVRPGMAGPEEMMRAYTAVLIKDVLWSLNELLTYKQMEIHK